MNSNGGITASNIWTSNATVSNLVVPTSVTFPTNFSINTGTTGTLTTSNPSIIGGTHSNGTFSNGSFQGTFVGSLIGTVTSAMSAGTCVGNAATATTATTAGTCTDQLKSKKTKLLKR